MEKLDMIYEGKAKKVYKTDDEKIYWIEFKDDATAFNGLKKGSIANKGVMNNKISTLLFKYLEQQGIANHLVEMIDERNMLVKAVEIIPIEVVVRNYAAGSLAERLGVEEGLKMNKTIIEFYYKDDFLNDPMINHYHIYALELASTEEMKEIEKNALQINELLSAVFAKINIDLVDFKLEFGRYADRIILADEISPDTCRLWDSTTKEKLDKDRFRRDLGGVESAYHEILNRLEEALNV